MTDNTRTWSDFTAEEMINGILNAESHGMSEAVIAVLFTRLAEFYPAEAQAFHDQLKKERADAGIQIPLAVPEVSEQGGHEHEHDQVSANMRASHWWQRANGARRSRGSKS